MGCMHNPRKEKFEFFEETIKNGAQIDQNDEFTKQLNEFKNEYSKWEQSTHDRLDSNASKAAQNEKTYRTLAAKFDNIVKKLAELIPKETKNEVKLKKITLKEQIEKIVNNIKAEELERDNALNISKPKA